MDNIQKGDKGLGDAISYFTSKGYTVSLPLTDSQKYDLIVEIEDKLNKVQVKTTESKSKYDNDDYVVYIKTTHKQTDGSNKILKFNNTKIDLLYVLCGDNTRYCMPTKNIKSECNLTLNNRYENFIVG